MVNCSETVLNFWHINFQHINFYNWCYRGSTHSIYVLHLRDASRTEDIVSLIRIAVTPPRGPVRTCGIWFQNSLYNWQHAICSGKHIEQSRTWYVRAWLDRNNMTRHKFSQHEYKKNMIQKITACLHDEENLMRYCDLIHNEAK